MNISEDRQHDLLLVITSIILILFTTGLAVPSETPINTTIITSG